MTATRTWLGRLALPIAMAAMLAAPLLRAADDASDTLVVIVNPGSGVQALSRNDAINIFMGRYRKLPSGLLAFPIDVGEHGHERRLFYERLVDKTLAEVESYWSRLVFSGQTSPPLQVPDDATALALVAGNRAAIAYVLSSSVDDRVRVVLELPPP